MTSTTNDSSFASPHHAQLWARKELWSFFELQVICCHLVPHLPETIDLTDGEGYENELLEARQTIERGIYAKTLKYVPQPGSEKTLFRTSEVATSDRSMSPTGQVTVTSISPSP